jgi:hypothetical protein
MCPLFRNLMLINRDIALQKLNAHLSQGLSREELYEWALGLAVSEDYQSLSQSDPLLRATLDAMMKFNRKDPAKSSPPGALEYYRRCLAGEAEFVPGALAGAPKASKPADGETSSADPSFPQPKSLTFKESIEQFREWKYSRDVFLVARLYVVVFAVCCFVVQVSSVINPGFMQIGLWVPSRGQALLAAIPHLFYAYLVLLPPRRLIQGKMYLPSLLAFILGAAYYWRMSFLIVTQLSLNWIFLLVMLPFSAIPATLALILLLAEKQDFFKSQLKHKLL